MQASTDIFLTKYFEIKTIICLICHSLPTLRNYSTIELFENELQCNKQMSNRNGPKNIFTLIDALNYFRIWGPNSTHR